MFIRGLEVPEVGLERDVRIQIKRTVILTPPLVDIVVDFLFTVAPQQVPYWRNIHMLHFDLYLAPGWCGSGFYELQKARTAVIGKIDCILSAVDVTGRQHKFLRALKAQTASDIAARVRSWCSCDAGGTCSRSCIRFFHPGRFARQ